MSCHNFTVKLILLSLGGLFLFYGCATTTSKVGGGELLPVQEQHFSYHLAALDQVEFELPGGVTKAGKLNQQGDLQIESNAPVRLLGLTPQEAEVKLRAIYPKLTKIRWVEYREASVSVLGEVYNQTKVDISEAPIRVLDVVAAAGGFTPLADLTNVTLVRRNAGDTKVFILNLGAATKGISPQFNLLVEPGDVITVRRNLL